VALNDPEGDGRQAQRDGGDGGQALQGGGDPLVDAAQVGGTAEIQRRDMSHLLDGSPSCCLLMRLAQTRAGTASQQLWVSPESDPEPTQEFRAEPHSRFSGYRFLSTDVDDRCMASACVRRPEQPSTLVLLRLALWITDAWPGRQRG
jgi:hypothetical protein